MFSKPLRSSGLPLPHWVGVGKREGERINLFLMATEEPAHSSQCPCPQCDGVHAAVLWRPLKALSPPLLPNSLTRRSNSIPHHLLPCSPPTSAPQGPCVQHPLVVVHLHQETTLLGGIIARWLKPAPCDALCPMVPWETHAHCHTQW